MASAVARHGPAMVAVGNAAGKIAASWWTVALAALVFSAKYGIEFFKLGRDYYWDRRDRSIAPTRAKAAVEIGLRKFDRHQNQNWLVLKTIERQMGEGKWLPMEYHILKLSTLTPDWTADAVLAELDPGHQRAIAKLVRMVPNFQYEYDQALLLIQQRDRLGFLVMLDTLITKARVGMRDCRTVYEAVFGKPLERLEPELDSPFTDDPVSFEKPIDFYPWPEQEA